MRLKCPLLNKMADLLRLFRRGFFFGGLPMIDMTTKFWIAKSNWAAFSQNSKGSYIARFLNVWTCQQNCVTFWEVTQNLQSSDLFIGISLKKSKMSVQSREQTQRMQCTGSSEKTWPPLSHFLFRLSSIVITFLPSPRHSKRVSVFSSVLKRMQSDEKWKCDWRGVSVEMQSRA